jgi:nucleoside-diphosphate-sugar epimerase
MAKTIFVAGAAGAVGRPLCVLLRRAGYVVHGTTRKPEAAEWLRQAGVTPVLLDVFDAKAVRAAVAEARPDVIIHQLTDLSGGFDEASLRRNAEIRRAGTQNLIAAAIASGTRRFIAQSIAWAYAAGEAPRAEDDPLDTGATGLREVSIGGVVALEEAVIGAGRVEGIVLRYGHFYGEGTGAGAAPQNGPAVHVEAAAQAALLAIERGRGGIYNIAEPGAAVSSEKARRELGWDSGFRLA